MPRRRCLSDLWSPPRPHLRRRPRFDRVRPAGGRLLTHRWH